MSTSSLAGSETIPADVSIATGAVEFQLNILSALGSTLERILVKFVELDDRISEEIISLT